MILKVVLDSLNTCTQQCQEYGIHAGISSDTQEHLEGDLGRNQPQHNNGLCQAYKMLYFIDANLISDSNVRKSLVSCLTSQNKNFNLPLGEKCNSPKKVSIFKRNHIPLDVYPQNLLTGVYKC